MSSETDLLAEAIGDDALAGPKSATALVAAELRRLIGRGDLVPGTRLRQTEIAERLHVSSTPVREAFRLLQGDGLISIRPRIGAIVAQPSKRDVAEIYKIRWALESLALEESIPKFSEGDVRECERLLQVMDSASEPEEYLQAHHALHMRTYTPSDMNHLCSMIQALRSRFAVYYHMLARLHPPDEITQLQHYAIVRACRDGNVGDAKLALSNHFKKHQSIILEYLDSADDKSTSVPSA